MIEGHNEVFSMTVQGHKFIRVGSYDEGCKTWISVDQSEDPTELTLGDIMFLIKVLSARAEEMVPEELQ